MECKRVMAWLAQHRWAAAGLALAYLAFVVLAHDHMQKPAHWAQNKLGSERWNMLVVAVGIPLLMAFGGWMVLRLFRHPSRRRACTYIVVTLALTVVSFFTLLQVNIEMVHLPQYALFALLVYPLTRRLSDTMIIATAGGILDEAWQYFYLHGHWGTYYDVNDVILNTVGAGMGVTALYIRFPPDSDCRADSERFRLGEHKIVIAAGVVIVAGIVLAATGLLRATRNPNPEEWVIALRRCDLPGSFWLTTSWGKTYHQVQAIPGALITLALVVFYCLLDYLPIRRIEGVRKEAGQTELQAVGD